MPRAGRFVPGLPGLLIVLLLVVGGVASLRAGGRGLIEVEGEPQGEVFFREEDGLLVLGNRRVEFYFDTARGAALIGITDKESNRPLHAEGRELLGQWSFDFEQGAVASGAMEYEGGRCRFGEREVVLSVHLKTAGGRWVQKYRVSEGGAFLETSATYHHERDDAALVRTVQYTLDDVAIGGSITDNEYLYPPTWLHFMRGMVADATPELMQSRYIYGADQRTDKMMLPYMMIRDEETAVSLAAVDDHSKTYLAVLGGERGVLKAAFDVFRVMPPRGTQATGTVYLTVLNGHWEKSMDDMRTMLMKEAGFRAPSALPDFVKDLVIVWHGIPGVKISRFKHLEKELDQLEAAGANAVIIGGKLWNCPASGAGAGTIFDYIPLPVDGKVVPGEDVGGKEGLKELVQHAHRLKMKLFTWGPVSMAGIARQSPEAAANPDWWIYQENGEFNDWYKFMAPANPNSPGWRKFVLENVHRVVEEYGLDGLWLDSTWLDHQLDYKAPDGWYGGPNGAKMSLLKEIVETTKAAHPEVVLMGEVSGARAMSLLDVAYLQVHGIWPAVAPEELQEMIKAQELSRLPGVRPFGQIELGLGFYADLTDERSAKLAREYEDSWIAKTFLVSTLERVPVYFGLSWGINLLESDEASSVGDNPDLAKARQERERFKRWFEVFKKINAVRKENRELIDGATLFDAVEVSSPPVVHYIRKGAGGSAVVLLNAGKDGQEVKVRLRDAEAAGISPQKHYRVLNRMNDRVIPMGAQENWSGRELLESGFTVKLAGYEGAVIKFLEP